MITVDYSVLNQFGTPMFYSDVFANRPAAGIEGRLFVSTDTKLWYRDTGSTWDLIGNPGTVTSIGLSMPSAFTVSNSPITGSGTIGVTGAGTVSQYIRGDGTLADFPGTGGGSSVSYYLNGGTNQGTFVGNTYYQMSKTANTGAAANFTISANGYITQFITDAGDPGLLNIPAGNWNVQAYFSSSANGGTPQFYVELYKYNGSAFTLIASSSSNPEIITGGTSTDLYYTSIAVPATTLTVTDRLAIRFYVNNDGKTITLYTQGTRLSQVITTFTTGITAINGSTEQVQFLATGTTGTDFNISTASATHTFNLPVASGTNTGKLSSTDWTTFNNKQNAITLTTVGTSGVATFIGSTLNIPDYSSGIAAGYVPNTRTLTINGTSYDLSANRTWSVGTVTSVGLSTGTTGTDVNVSGSPVTGSSSITLNIPIASATNTGKLSSTDWTTFNSKQSAITLTTTGNSGASTFVSNTLNIPTYTLAGLGGVPTTRTITINGTAQDLSADRTYSVGTVTSVGLLTGTTGTDVNVSGSPVTGSGSITLNIPDASSVNRGALTSTDWTTFNNKQSTITLTTTGTSGAATFVSNTLNIPQYQGAITLTTTGSSGAATLVGTTLNIPNYGSALSGYLPLTGGTLTGALAGTSSQMSLSSTAASFIPTGSTIPTNGMYLSAANTLDFATASTNAITISSTQRVGINTAPTTDTLTVKGNITTTNGGNVTAAGMVQSGSTISSGLNITAVDTIAGASFIPQGSTAPVTGMYLSSAGTIGFSAGTALRLSVSSSQVTSTVQTLFQVADTGVGTKTIVQTLERTSASPVGVNREVGLVFKDGNNPTLVGGITGIRYNSGGNYYGGLKFYVQNSFSTPATTFSNLYTALELDYTGYANFISGISAVSLSTTTSGSIGTSLVVGSTLSVNSPSSGATGEGIVVGRSFKIDATGSGQRAVQYMVSDTLSNTYGSGLQLQGANTAGDKAFGFNLNTSGDFELYTKSGGTFTKGITQTATGNVLINSTSNLSGKFQVETSDNTIISQFRSSTGMIQIYPYYSSYGGAIIQSLTGNGSAYNTLRYEASKHYFANGEVLINTTTDAGGYDLQVNGRASFKMTSDPAAETICVSSTTSGSAQYGIFVQGDAGNYTVRAMRFFDSGVGQSVVGNITIGTTSTTYNTTSDYRLKEDFKDFNGLELISKIKTYDFKWKNYNERMYGVIAHELQEILPYAITGVKDDINEMQSADYSKLTPILIKAIQEQQIQIKELKKLYGKAN